MTKLKQTVAVRSVSSSVFAVLCCSVISASLRRAQEATLFSSVRKPKTQISWLFLNSLRKLRETTLDTGVSLECEGVRRRSVSREARGGSRLSPFWKRGDGRRRRLLQPLLEGEVAATLRRRLGFSRAEEVLLRRTSSLARLPSPLLDSLSSGCL